MPAPAIHVENLSKRFLLGERAPYRRFSEAIVSAFKLPSRRASDKHGNSGPSHIWALRDVSFEVAPGEVLGIIGRNGAGKSTLLKILSRITDPTDGTAEIRGRVGSLLEVGTGFHPELTGRENVFLNGAILGMKRAEIQRKFDEIVAFAEVETFLDTPVKHYSSGMYTRLAFAVAAHLEPEILIVDEVLAVGDAVFQKRCLGKMSEVADGGRTVLFVSHNMAALMNLCHRAVLLEHGRLTQSGPAQDVVAAYLADDSQQAVPLGERTDRRGTGAVRFTSVQAQGAAGTSLICGQDVKFVLSLENSTGGTLQSISIAVGIDNDLGTRVAHLNSDVSGTPLSQVPPGASTLEITVPHLPLVEGRYVLTLFATVGGEIADWVVRAMSIQVHAGDFYGTGKLPPRGQGNCLFPHTFQQVPSADGGP